MGSVAHASDPDYKAFADAKPALDRYSLAVRPCRANSIGRVELIKIEGPADIRAVMDLLKTGFQRERFTGGIVIELVRPAHAGTT